MAKCIQLSRLKVLTQLLSHHMNTKQTEKKANNKQNKARKQNKTNKQKTKQNKTKQKTSKQTKNNTNIKQTNKQTSKCGLIFSIISCYCNILRMNKQTSNDCMF